MRVMSRFALLLSLGVALGLNAQVPVRSDSTRALFQRLITERTTASADADTAALRRLVDPTMVYLDNDGSRRTMEEHLRSIAAAGKEEGIIHQVDSLHVFRAGDVALVDYRSTISMRFGSRDLVWPYRSLDTFARRSGGWLLIRHAEMHILAVPSPVALDSAALDEYVGRYEWWPGNVDTIRRQGNQLSHQLTIEERAIPIVPATRESFHEVGDPTLVVFARDSTGRVAGYVMHFPDGQVVRARKLP